MYSCVCKCQKRPEDGAVSPRPRDTDGCEPPDTGAENQTSNFGSFKEQQTLLTTKSSLQLLVNVVLFFVFVSFFMATSIEGLKHLCLPRLNKVTSQDSTRDLYFFIS